MIYTLIIGILGIVGMALGWLVVQIFWGATFSDHISDDDDVLAGRSSCSNCGCTTICQEKGQSITIN